MKKRIIALFLVLVLAIVWLTGCSSTKPKTEFIHSPVTGTYTIFKTNDVEIYLNFLENFYEPGYEIVDITINEKSGIFGIRELYAVTYKTIETE